jgi:hypothetical protein
LELWIFDLFQKVNRKTFNDDDAGKISELNDQLLNAIELFEEKDITKENVKWTQLDNSIKDNFAKIAQNLIKFIAKAAD